MPYLHGPPASCSRQCCDCQYRVKCRVPAARYIHAVADMQCQTHIACRMQQCSAMCALPFHTCMTMCAGQCMQYHTRMQLSNTVRVDVRQLTTRFLTYISMQHPSNAGHLQDHQHCPDAVIRWKRQCLSPSLFVRFTTFLPQDAEALQYIQQVILNVQATAGH